LLVNVKKKSKSCAHPYVGGVGSRAQSADWSFIPDDGDNAIHGSSEIAVWILYAAVGPGRLGLIVGIKHRVKAAVERENSLPFEAEPEGASIGRKHDVRAQVSRGIEGVIADDRMVVAVVVDPLHCLPHPNGYGKRREAVLSGYDDLTYHWCTGSHLSEGHCRQKTKDKK